MSCLLPRHNPTSRCLVLETFVRHNYWRGGHSSTAPSQRYGPWNRSRIDSMKKVCDRRLAPAQTEMHMEQMNAMASVRVGSSVDWVLPIRAPAKATVTLRRKSREIQQMFPPGEAGTVEQTVPPVLRVAFNSLRMPRGHSGCVTVKCCFSRHGEGDSLPPPA